MRADLIVLSPELPEVQLIVEIKLRDFERADAEAQLKQYMVARGCPLGLLITSQTTWMLQDSYEGTGEDSIHVVGEYPTVDLLRLDSVPDSEPELIARVHDWLEALAASGHPRHAGSSTREDVARYLLPAVVEGRVITEASL